MSKDLIKDIILILLGGGVASTIIVTAFQSLINKIIENSANMIIEKKMESFRTKLNRAMSAYEMLLDKEMKFYEQFDSHKALFVPLIQDMVYYLELSVKNPDVPQNCENYRTKVLEYFGMIPRIKNDVLLYESYIPPKIKTVVADFVSFLQDEVTFWGLYCEILFGVKDDHINIDAAKAKCEESLRFCALIETMIYSRLKELSGDDKRRTKNS